MSTTSQLTTLTGLRDDLKAQIEENREKMRLAQRSAGFNTDKNPEAGLKSTQVVYWAEKADKIQVRLASIESKIRGHFESKSGASLREFLTFGESTLLELPVESRDLLRPTGVAAGTDSFVPALFGALVDTVPLLHLATVITTRNGGDLDLNFVTAQPTAPGVVADGAAMTVIDPTFGEIAFGAPFKYPAHLRFSSELIEDWSFDLEGYLVDRVRPTIERRLANDLWRGAGGTTAPAGLATAATTVNAAGAAAVVLADIENLISAVPSAYRTGGHFAIIMAPAAYMNLRTQKDTAGAYLWPPTAPDVLFGFPVYVDNALAAPATTARSVVAGDFRAAYAIRVLPVQFRTSEQNAFNLGQVSSVTTLRADGRTMITGAVRALLHP